MENNDLLRKDVHGITDRFARVENSYEMSSRGKQSKYFLQHNILLQKGAHGFTDHVVRAVKFIRVEFDGSTIEVLSAT